MDRYEWDEAKNLANWLKHGVRFELIADFDWANAITRIDDRLGYGEMRRLAYGRIGEQNYAVVFVIRGERLRIISLRRMHAKEMRKHEH